MSSLHRTIGLVGLTGLLTLGYGPRTSEAEDADIEGRPDVVRVEVKSVWKASTDPRFISPANVVFLKDLRAQRLLPVWIGHFEADHIQTKLKGQTLPRPMTHDLLKSTIQALGAKVRYILVDALMATGGRDSGTFFAKIALSLKDGSSVEVDSRTSDAIALSVRTGTPIYVSAGIMEGNSIADEKELEKELSGEGAEQKPSGKPEKKEKKAGKDYY
jgi:bifunctional DNase/RNase